MTYQVRRLPKISQTNIFGDYWAVCEAGQLVPFATFRRHAAAVRCAARLSAH